MLRPRPFILLTSSHCTGRDIRPRRIAIAFPVPLTIVPAFPDLRQQQLACRLKVLVALHGANRSLSC